MGELAAYVSDNAGLLLERTGNHLQISGLAMLGALLVALPPGLWLGHTGRGGAIAINSTNVGRAIPTLALIALFLPLFGLSDLTTIAALIILAIPPILTNTYTGIRDIDREIVEAARGMGMRPSQILLRVELPLAAPVVLAGIRTSAVQVVATAALGAVIAGADLGRFIVDGFANGNTDQILTGALAVGALAMLVELGLMGVERLVTPKGVAVRGRRRQAPGPGPSSGSRINAASKERSEATI